ncbi:MAG: permease [Epsilonproteobacteria bacterium]|nr:permease [Campylobacterota bacterium]
MKKKKFSFRGLPFLAFVVVLYIVLYFFYPEKITLSFGKSLHLFVKVLPIFGIVILATTLINLLVEPKKFSKHLGEEAGFKGWLIALIAGVISHGPMYAWYPMFSELKKHGLKNGLIATFFYARAVKLPLLPLMADYFGIAFTAILTLYILIASLLQGFIIDKICPANSK